MWLRNITKGQLTRVRRNCSEVSDFLLQAEVVKNKFTEKGYREESLASIISDLASIPRENLLGENNRVVTDTGREWNFFSGFHTSSGDLGVPKEIPSFAGISSHFLFGYGTWSEGKFLQWDTDGENKIWQAL